MKRLIGAVIAAVVLTLGISSTASAVPNTYWGETAREAAQDLHCKHFKPYHHLRGSYTVGTCTMHGKRVAIYTFKNSWQEYVWNFGTRVGQPRHFYWAAGRGVTLHGLHPRGGKAIAKYAAKRMNPGRVLHG